MANITHRAVWLLAGAGLGIAGAAGARQPPAPGPSGIVVHLFGPDSIASNVLPTAPLARPGQAPGPAGQAGTAPTALSGGDVLHQMFVTGDPDRPDLPSKGRTGQLPR